MQYAVSYVQAKETWEYRQTELNGKKISHKDICFEFYFFCLSSLVDTQYAYPNEVTSLHNIGRHNKPL